MKQRLLLILALLLIVKFTYSQFIDRCGINIGASYSTQIWDYKLITMDQDNKYGFGLQSFLQAEKDFGNHFTLRAEGGYIQKGFKNNKSFTSTDGSFVKTSNDNVTLHNLALNLGIKIKPLKFDYSPYLLLGVRSDYLISYNDVEFEESASGKKFKMYESTIEDFNKFNFGGLIGLGLDINGLMYLEFEYNPNFTKNYNDPGLSVRDNCWGVKLGFNIIKASDRKSITS